MANNSYIEQINACFEYFDYRSSLKRRRNQLVKEMYMIAGKYSKLEFAISKQAQNLQASNPELNAVLISLEEVKFIKQLADTDAYLSELIDCYLDELSEVEAQLNNLETEALELAC